MYFFTSKLCWNFILEEILTTREILDSISQDLLLTAIAGAFIFFGISFQTSSLFLGIFGIVNIALAYPLSLFVCKSSRFVIGFVRV
jgi:hypothetical protein